MEGRKGYISSEVYVKDNYEELDTHSPFLPPKKKVLELI